MSVFLDDRPLTDTVRDVLTVDGALAPAVELRTPQAVANSLGTWGTGVTVNARSITVGLDVWPTTTVDRVTVMDTLKRRVGGLRLFRMADSLTRETYVTLTDLSVEFYHIAQPRCFVALQFSAVDPTRYEREARAVALSTSRTETLLGTVPSAPVVYLYGASPSVVNPVVIVRNDSGDETHRLTLTGTLATNDALVIDGARQQIDRYVAGVLQTGTSSGNAWLTSGQFPLLAPEDGIEGVGVTVELSATTGTPTGLLLYTRGY
jgi:hypothetical protein